MNNDTPATFDLLGVVPRYRGMDLTQPFFVERQKTIGGHAQAPACSSKRTVRFISGIALDQCRARERYPARRPIYISERKVAPATSNEKI